jgi:hypothetical protein
MNAFHASLEQRDDPALRGARSPAAMSSRGPDDDLTIAVFILDIAGSTLDSDTGEEPRHGGWQPQPNGDFAADSLQIAQTVKIDSFIGCANAAVQR